MMTKTVVYAGVSCVMLGLCVGEALSVNKIGEGDIEIYVSPSTLILGAEQTAYVKVHTDIAFSAVDRSSVALNEIPVAWTKADDRGELVAAFVEAEVKAIVAPPQAVLTLTGKTLSGVSFSGSDTVRVIIDPSPDN